jgi:uncharacterized protein YjbI with pentapeptide repeats
MANEEHVALLKQGVAGWNAWRNKNRDIRPDLSGANLRWVNLCGAELHRADLSASPRPWGLEISEILRWIRWNLNDVSAGVSAQAGRCPAGPDPASLA